MLPQPRKLFDLDAQPPPPKPPECPLKPLNAFDRPNSPALCDQEFELRDRSALTFRLKLLFTVRFKLAAPLYALW
jgi:hypothetical protein